MYVYNDYDNLVDDGNMVYEFTPTDSNSYTYGHRLISSDDAKYVLNAHGDVVALLDATNNITKRYDYDAFGNELSLDTSDTNPFRYCAEYFDAETGAIYLRARYYSPGTGRFTQLDPIKDGLNWYAYCCNNPVVFIDIWGLEPSPLEAAYMARDIYNLEIENVGQSLFIDEEDTGWVLDAVRYGRESMKMGVFKKVHSDGAIEYAVAFKGTSNIQNWMNNAESYLSEKSADMWDAINYSYDFVNKNANSEITFVGHSKGGGEAIAAAAYTGRAATTFNAANFAFEEYGISNNNGASILNFYVMGDVLHNAIGVADIGITVPLPEVYNTKTNSRNFIYNSLTNISNMIKNHGIDTVIIALGCKQMQGEI